MELLMLKIEVLFSVVQKYKRTGLDVFLLVDVFSILVLCLSKLLAMADPAGYELLC